MDFNNCFSNIWSCRRVLRLIINRSRGIIWVSWRCSSTRSPTRSSCRTWRCYYNTNLVQLCKRISIGILKPNKNRVRSRWRCLRGSNVDIWVLKLNESGCCSSQDADCMAISIRVNNTWKNIGNWTWCLDWNYFKIRGELWRPLIYSHSQSKSHWSWLRIANRRGSSQFYQIRSGIRS